MVLSTQRRSWAAALRYCCPKTVYDAATFKKIAISDGESFWTFAKFSEGLLNFVHNPPYNYHLK